MKLTKLIPFVAFSLVAGAGFAQNQEEAPERDKKGFLTGSFETNTFYYVKDTKPTNGQDKTPVDRFGSNNYLKVDYVREKFTAGIQLESYLPAAYGYEGAANYHGTKLTNIYASWVDDSFSITAGSFYEQFGSGLLFRAWEDRALGTNNALMGARFTYNFKKFVAVKAIWGTPRLGMEYDTDAQFRGLDLSLNISEMYGARKSTLLLEGSVLNHFDKVPSVYENEMSPNTTGWSARLNYENGGFMVKGEYVDAGTNYYNRTPTEDNPSEFIGKRGNAQLIELGYSNNGLGIFLSGRRLEWMYSSITRNGSAYTGNVFNYIPAMTLQYTYLLTNLHPFTPQTGDNTLQIPVPGEIGGQADIYYNVKRGTWLGGKRGLKLHANFSTYYGLQREGSARSRNMLFRDFNADIEKQWTRSFKMNLLYSMQERNTSYGVKDETELAHIIVGDFLYKFTPRFSLRLELQYLISQEGEKDWMAGLLEAAFAPKWSIFVSDMYNHGNDNSKLRLHYYSGGVSFAHAHTRLQLSYGRNRAGYVCSGGVCREQPAYTGANFAMTISF